MRILPTILVLAGLAAPAARPAAAQESDEGYRARLLALGGYTAEGELRRMTEDSVVLESPAVGTVGLPLAALRRLEVLRPRTTMFHAVRRGVMWGAVIGVVATAAAAVANERGIVSATEVGIPIIGVSLVGGGVAGALLLRGWSWQSVPLPDR